MSFTFLVNCPTPPKYEDVLARLGVDDLRTDAEEEHPQENVPWPEGVLHFFRDKVSTRGCEVSFENDSFSVRINTLASPQDYDLGLRFIETAAKLARQDIHTEDGLELQPAKLREVYNAEWIEETNAFGLQSVMKMVRDDPEIDDGNVMLMGCVRPFHVGRRLLTELESAGPAEELLKRFMKLFRQVQFADADDRYYAAETMSATKADGEEFTLSVFAPGVDYLFPDVPFLVLANDDEEIVRISVETARKLPHFKWKWLDEAQMLVEAVPEEHWPEVLAAARQHNLD